MKRRGFLTGAASLVAGLRYGPLKVPPQVIEPIVETVPLSFVDSTQLVASGGLCVPLEPFYEISILQHPIRDALPSFNAKRS